MPTIPYKDSILYTNSWLRCLHFLVIRDSAVLKTYLRHRSIRLSSFFRSVASAGCLYSAKEFIPSCLLKLRTTNTLEPTGEFLHKTTQIGENHSKYIKFSNGVMAKDSHLRFRNVSPSLFCRRARFLNDETQQVSLMVLTKNSVTLLCAKMWHIHNRRRVVACHHDGFSDGHRAYAFAELEHRQRAEQSRRV